MLPSLGCTRFVSGLGSASPARKAQQQQDALLLIAHLWCTQTGMTQLAMATMLCYSACNLGYLQLTLQLLLLITYNIRR
jgi:hypothetical protein